MSRFGMFRGIALRAKVKSGKTWSCKYLLNDSISSQRDYAFTGIYSFADVARQMYAEIMNMSVKLLYDERTKEYFRPNFINWCDEKRKENSRIFVDAWLERLPKEGNWLCDDLRYPNELGAVIEAGGVAIQIDCPKELREERGWKFVQGVDDHPTECSLDGHPYFSEPLHRIRNERSEHYNKAVLDRLVNTFILGEGLRG